MSTLHDALSALLEEHRQSVNPAPYTSERALVERAEALLAQYPACSSDPDTGCQGSA